MTIAFHVEQLHFFFSPDSSKNSKLIFFSNFL